ncbi:MAG TPA: DUF3047 domain-containing protein [Casimicrobiaceae bacterium]|nr:DUF3047 domain-containing protein [Casimicrobiaceae bacterium]
MTEDGKTMPRTGAQLYRRALRAVVVLGAVHFAVFAGSGAANADAPFAQPAAFSSLRAGAAFAPWTPITIAFGKRATRYDLVDDAGTTVLHAIADDSASALACPMRLALRDAPTIGWRWKISRTIANADSRRASREDAPARIVLEFAGDVRRLPLLERGVYAVARRVAGRELPYATLMYIWSNHEPVGTLLPNPHTRRIQMIVAASGDAGANAWQAISRNVRDDFVRAFGEEPGIVTAVGVMTDTDNTESHAEAWYGDIRFGPATH